MTFILLLLFLLSKGALTGAFSSNHQVVRYYDNITDCISSSSFEIQPTDTITSSSGFRTYSSLTTSLIDLNSSAFHSSSWSHTLNTTKISPVRASTTNHPNRTTSATLTFTDITTTTSSSPYIVWTPTATTSFNQSSVISALSRTKQTTEVQNGTTARPTSIPVTSTSVLYSWTCNSSFPGSVTSSFKTNQSAFSTTTNSKSSTTFAINATQLSFTRPVTTPVSTARISTLTSYSSTTSWNHTWINTSSSAASAITVYTTATSTKCMFGSSGLIFECPEHSSQTIYESAYNLPSTLLTSYGTRSF